MRIQIILAAALVMTAAACSGATVSNEKHPRVGAGVTADRVAGR